MTDIKANEAEQREPVDLARQGDGEDAAPEKAPEQAERGPRDAHAAAVANYRAMRDAALAPKPEPEDEPAKEAADADHGDEPEDEPETKTQPDDSFEITTFGKTRKLTRDEMIRLAQKSAAADVRLQEANELIQRLQSQVKGGQPAPAQATEPKPEQAEPKAATPAKPAKQEITVPPLSEKDASRLARALQMGDEDESRAAIQEMYQKATEQAVALYQNGRDAPERDATQSTDINQMLDDRFRQEREQNLLRQDLEAFGREYQDIVTDPRLTQVAVVETHRLRAQDLIDSGVWTEESVRQVEALARTDAGWAQHLAELHRDLERRGLATRRLDLFMAAGKATREWAGHGQKKPNGAARELTESERAEAEALSAKKKAEKKAMPQQPRATTRRNEAPVPPSREDRQKSYIRTLMKERGTLVAR